MPSPLPILVGVGLLLLIATSGSAKAAEPEAAPSASGPYAAGYALGYADGVAGKSKTPAANVLASPAAKSSGDPTAYANGYADGYAKGFAAKPKPYESPPTEVSCIGPGVKMSLAAAQEILMGRGFFKGPADGKCSIETSAALASYQVNKSLLLATPGILDTITEALLNTETSTSTPIKFKTNSEAFADGMQLRTARATDANYVSWFSKGRYVRGYQDEAIAGPDGKKYNNNPNYLRGWDDHALGKADETVWPY